MRRKLGRITDFLRAQSIEELRLLARRRLPHFAFEYIDGGAEDERSVRRNLRAFRRIGFAPRSLANTDKVDLGVSLFERWRATPLIVAPTGFNGMLTSGADVKIARAAASLGIASTLSTVSNQTIEEVAGASRALRGEPWFQLYVLRDRGTCERLVERALQMKCEALVFTVDAAVFGSREWDRRNFAGPAQLDLRNRLDVLQHPRWLFDVMIPHGAPRFAHIQGADGRGARANSGTAYITEQMDRGIGWDELAWLRRIWPGKLLVKGLLRSDDALRARDTGADGVILSNHGGRQLDGAISALEVLPQARRELGASYPLLVDGGVRRGTDVVKAMALGATAVMVGRAVLYGVAAGGEAGARHALQLLLRQTERTLGHLGCSAFADLRSDMLRLPGFLKESQP